MNDKGNYSNGAGCDDMDVYAPLSNNLSECELDVCDEEFV